MTTTQSLPEKPHLDRLRGEAKLRHAALKAVSQAARLSDAQLLVARAYGFPNWMALKAEVDRRRALWTEPAWQAPPLWSLLRPQTRIRQPSGVFALASPGAAEAVFFPALLAVLTITQAFSVMVCLLHLAPA